MQRRIKHIFSFAHGRPWEQGFVNVGFHGSDSPQYFLHYNDHWLDCLTPEDQFVSGFLAARGEDSSSAEMAIYFTAAATR